MTTDPSQLSWPIVGDYDQVERLGAGAFSNVYKVRERSLGVTYAAKVFREDFLTDPHLRELIFQEGQVLARLKHPNIVRVHRLIKQPLTLIMDHIEGMTLEQALSQRSASLCWEELASLVVPLARAMAEAHRSKIIHRDLKPANIILADGLLSRPVIIDFGVASVLPRHTLTQARSGGMVVGTPGFMGPEQIQGAPARVTDDVYALGAILAEAATGRPAVPGATLEEIFANTTQGQLSPAIAALEPRLATIIRRAMSTDHRQRYPSMSALLEDWSALARAPVRLPTIRHPIGAASRHSRTVVMDRPIPFSPAPEVAPSVPGSPRSVRPAIIAGAVLAGMLLMWLVLRPAAEDAPVVPQPAAPSVTTAPSTPTPSTPTSAVAPATAAPVVVQPTPAVVTPTPPAPAAETTALLAALDDAAPVLSAEPALSAGPPPVEGIHAAAVAEADLSQLLTVLQEHRRSGRGARGIEAEDTRALYAAVQRGLQERTPSCSEADLLVEMISQKDQLANLQAVCAACWTQENPPRATESCVPGTVLYSGHCIQASMKFCYAYASSVAGHDEDDDSGMQP
ncbi:MAG: protein kinase [Myxococcota bacterium]|nr:protein kinase [Myxococcota bacterium]